MPKDADAERYLGKPGEIKTTTARGGYQRDTKIGEDGRAVSERHYTDHNRSDKHSNPHDHVINWDNPTVHPAPHGPINYFEDNIPEFKCNNGGSYTMSLKNNNNQFHFDSIADFQESMRYHAEVAFEHNGKEYGIIPAWDAGDGKLAFYVANKPETEIIFNSSDDLLDHIIDDKKLRDIITEVEVLDRTI